MNNPASNFGATPDPRLPTDPDPHRRFLIDLDNELSGAIRRLRSVRQAIQKELGWDETDHV